MNKKNAVAETTAIYPSTTLQSLVLELRSVEECLLSNGGEITPELEEELGTLETHLAVKADNYDHRIKMLSARADAFKARAEEFTKSARAIQNYSDRLKDAVKQAMLKLGKSEINGDFVRFKLSATKPRMILDETKVPRQFFTQVVSEIPDKKRIEEASQFAEIPGVSFEQGYALRTYATVK